jgi:hypothetical protein
VSVLEPRVTSNVDCGASRSRQLQRGGRGAVGSVCGRGAGRRVRWRSVCVRHARAAEFTRAALAF